MFSVRRKTAFISQQASILLSQSMKWTTSMSAVAGVAERQQDAYTQIAVAAQGLDTQDMQSFTGGCSAMSRRKIRTRPHK